jgi:hypothetical protein
MEQILKIQSEQSFAETAKPGDFINSKLADFIIPGNTGSYDLSKSYININMEIIPANTTQTDTQGTAQPATNDTDTALYNNEIIYNGNTGGASVAQIVPASALVRNADLFSAARGMVESIRKVNTLRQILWNLESDKAEQHDGLDKIGTFQGRRGKNNETSSLIQIIGSNVNNAGLADTTKKAAALTRDYRIPLSDLFGVGNAMWNSDVFHDTRIHLELEPNLLAIHQLGGEESTSVYDPAGVNVAWGACDDYTVASGHGQLGAGEALGTVKPLITTIEYKEFQQDLPFYVGQAIRVRCTSANAGAQDYNVIIDAVEYNLGTNATNPPAGSQQVRIHTRTTCYTNAGGAENITATRIDALKSGAANDQIQINRAEIVLSQMPGVNAPDSIDYRTYSTEETQGINQTNYNKQIVVEPNCQNLIIAHCASGQTAPLQEWESYRLSINNVDVVGNRDIAYGKPLHEDRMLRFFNNRGQNVSNMTLQTISVDDEQNGAANQIPFYPILETMPLTRDEKIVNLELNSAGGAKDVVFYKELVRTI